MRKLLRPRATSSPDIMLQVAQLFYTDGWTKQKIARRLSIDARTVTATLNRARATGLVQILIRDTPEHSPAEQQIKAEFPHIERVLILPSRGPVKTSDQYGELMRRFGAVAADHFEELVRHHGSKPLFVAVGGGETVMEAITAIPEHVRPNVQIRVHSLVGHGLLDKSALHVNPIHNALLLWNRLGRVAGACQFATVPPLPDNLADLEPSLERLAKIPAIREAIEDMSRVDVVFAGIGMVSLPKTTPALRNRLAMTSLLHHLVTPEELAKQGAIADFSYHFIRENGESIMDPKHPGRPWRFFLTAGHYSDNSGIAFYQDLVNRGKKVIAIAGPFKLPAIRAALRAKAFSTLITDEDTARQITKGS